MKKLINVCLLVVLIAFTGSLKASESVSVEVTNSLVDVSLTNIVKGEKLNIKDYYGSVLYTTTLEEMPVYRKYFNFADLPNGLYFVETETPYDVTITKILKNEEKVSLIDNSEKIIFKPQISVDSKNVKVMFTNLHLDTLTVAIYDSEYNILETEISTKELYTKVYDFSRMPLGEYEIHFTLADKVFVEKISF